MRRGHCLGAYIPLFGISIACSIAVAEWPSRSCALTQAVETAKRNEELRRRAEARIAAALEANAAALQQRRAAFGEKQALTEQRAL